MLLYQAHCQLYSALGGVFYFTHLQVCIARIDDIVVVAFAYIYNSLFPYLKLEKECL